MDRNDSSTFRTGIFFFLLCKKSGHSLLLYHLAVSHQAGMVADIITFFQPLYLLTGIFRAFKTICNLPLCHAIFNLAFPAMLWFSLVTFQTACAWLSMITMFITNQAVHPTGGKHDRRYLFWHLHIPSLNIKKGMNTYFLNLSIPFPTLHNSLLRQYFTKVTMPTKSNFSIISA